MRKHSLFLTKITALLLTLCLSLPVPVFALRPTEMAEQSSGLADLTRALTVEVRPVVLAGLEESDPASVLTPRQQGEEQALQLLSVNNQETRVAVIGDVDWLGLLNKLYSKKLVNPVLVRIFQILKREVEGRGGMIYRQGGDEFVFLLSVKQPDKTDTAKLTQSVKTELDGIREAVAKGLNGRYVVVRSLSQDSNSIPTQFQNDLKAQTRYGTHTLFLLEVPESVAVANGNPAYQVYLETLLAAAPPGAALEPFVVEGNGGQFGLVKQGEKENPVTVSLGGQVVVNIVPEQVKEMYAALRFRAEDWLKEAKKVHRWKNVTAVGAQMQVPKHEHVGTPLLTQPPTLDGAPVLLQDYTPEKVRGPVAQDFAQRRSGILVQIIPRYVWKQELPPKYKDAQGFARFKALNEYLSYTAADQMLQLLLSGSVEGVRLAQSKQPFDASVGRAVSDESPDAVMVRLAWPKDQVMPPPADTQTWKRIEGAISSVVDAVEKNVNEYLRQHTEPEFQSIGLRVDLTWAATVADLNEQPNLTMGNHLGNLQSALAVVTWSGKQPGLAREDHFLYNTSKATSSADEQQIAVVNGLNQQADIEAAAVEAREVLSASGGMEETPITEFDIAGVDPALKVQVADLSVPFVPIPAAGLAIPEGVVSAAGAAGAVIHVPGLQQPYRLVYIGEDRFSLESRDGSDSKILTRGQVVQLTSGAAALEIRWEQLSSLGQWMILLRGTGYIHESNLERLKRFAYLQPAEDAIAADLQAAGIIDPDAVNDFIAAEAGYAPQGPRHAEIGQIAASRFSTVPALTLEERVDSLGNTQSLMAQAVEPELNWPIVGELDDQRRMRNIFSGLLKKIKSVAPGAANLTVSQLIRVLARRNGVDLGSSPAHKLVNFMRAAGGGFAQTDFWGFDSEIPEGMEAEKLARGLFQDSRWNLPDNRFRFMTSIYTLSEQDMRVLYGERWSGATAQRIYEQFSKNLRRISADDALIVLVPGLQKPPALAGIARDAAIGGFRVDDADRVQHGARPLDVLWVTKQPLEAVLKQIAAEVAGLEEVADTQGNVYTRDAQMSRSASQADIYRGQVAGQNVILKIFTKVAGGQPHHVRMLSWFVDQLRRSGIPIVSMEIVQLQDGRIGIRTPFVPQDMEERAQSLVRPGGPNYGEVTDQLGREADIVILRINEAGRIMTNTFRTLADERVSAIPGQVIFSEKYANIGFIRDQMVDFDPVDLEALVSYMDQVAPGDPAVTPERIFPRFFDRGLLADYIQKTQADYDRSLQYAQEAGIRQSEASWRQRYADEARVKLETARSISAISPAPVAGAEELAYTALTQDRLEAVLKLREEVFIPAVDPEALQNRGMLEISQGRARDQLQRFAQSEKTPAGLAGNPRPDDVITAVVAVDQNQQVVGYAFATMEGPSSVSLKEAAVAGRLQGAGLGQTGAETGTKLIAQMLRGILTASQISVIHLLDTSPQKQSARIAKRFGFKLDEQAEQPGVYTLNLSDAAIRGTLSRQLNVPAAGQEEFTYQVVTQSQLTEMFDLRRNTYLATVAPDATDIVIDDYLDTPLGKQFLSYVQDQGKTAQGIIADSSPAEGENHKIVGVFVATEPLTGRIVGYTYGESVRLLPGYSPLIDIKEIGVDPSFQKGGIGTELVRQLVRGFVDAYPGVRLRITDASEGDRTGRLVTRLGFQKIREIQGELSDEIRVEYGVDVVDSAAPAPGINPVIAVPKEQMLRLLESAAGLEEQIRVVSVEELERLEPELVAQIRAAGRSRAVLLPVSLASAPVEKASVSLFAQPSVSAGAVAVMPEGWMVGAFTEIPENDRSTGNELLRRATAAFGQGNSVVIALDTAFRAGLQLPAGHPVALLLSPNTYHLIDKAALAAFLARPDALVNLVLDLTKGTIQRVTIEGQDYFAIFA